MLVYLLVLTFFSDFTLTYKYIINNHSTQITLVYGLQTVIILRMSVFLYEILKTYYIVVYSTSKLRTIRMKMNEDCSYVSNRVK